MHRAGLLVLCLLLGSVAADGGAWGQTVPQALVSDLQWRLVGPFRGGRAVAVGGVAGSGRTFYFGAVDGGVWKTDDAGTVWRPLFDGQAVASIGALDVSVSDPRVVPKAVAADHVSGLWRHIFSAVPFESAVLLRRT